MTGTQLNVRLSSGAADALDAAVFVRSLKSPHDLVAPAIEKLATELLKDPDVAAAVELRRRRESPLNVAPMPKRRTATRDQALGPRGQSQTGP
jgi:hypothetical protein